MIKDNRGFVISELSISTIIIAFFIILFLAYSNVVFNVAKDVALQYELANIRMGIEHYRIINGDFPKKIMDLTKKTLTYKDVDGKIVSINYLNYFRIGKDDNLLDPFNNKYGYNNINGRVWSETKGRETW